MQRFILDPTHAAGDRYSSVVVTAESIARRAVVPDVFEKLIELSASLAPDKYTSYVTEFYKIGLAVAGPAWGYMDVVSVLYAIGELGQPANYLEIGVRRGRSACALASASPATDIYAFDMWQADYGGNENPGPDLVRDELKKVGHSGALHFVDGDSHKTIPDFFQRNPDLRFDCINVDGDHSILGAWDDLVNVAPRVRVGGVLVFDDTGNPYCPGLQEVWEEFLKLDTGLSGFSYGRTGTGISFAVRMRESPFSMGAIKGSVPRTLTRMAQELDSTPRLARTYSRVRTAVRNACPPAIWNGMRQIKRTIRGH
jgi:hypothetical protein